MLDILPKNINYLEQRFGKKTQGEDFSLSQFCWNFVRVYVNANVVIPENMVVIHYAKLTKFMILMIFFNYSCIVTAFFNCDMVFYWFTIIENMF